MRPTLSRIKPFPKGVHVMKRKRWVILASILFLVSCAPGGDVCTCPGNTSALPQSSSPASKPGQKAIDYLKSYGTLDTYGWYSVSQEKVLETPFKGYVEKCRWQLAYSPTDSANDLWELLGYHTLTNKPEGVTTTWLIEIPFVYGNFERSMGTLSGSVTSKGKSEKTLSYSFHDWSFDTNGTIRNWGTYTKGSSTDFTEYSSTFDDDNVSVIKSCGVYAIDYFNRLKNIYGWEDFALNSGPYQPLTEEIEPRVYQGLHQSFPSTELAVNWIKKVGQATSSSSGTYYLLKAQGLKGVSRYEYALEYDPWSSDFWLHGEVYPDPSSDIVFSGSLKFAWDQYSQPKYAKTTYFNRVSKYAFYVNGDLNGLKFDSDDTISSYWYTDTIGIYLPDGWDQITTIAQSVDAYNWAIHYFDVYAQNNP